MKIGLIDVDGHNFPNIPLMKISAHHKRKGDQVEWYNPIISGHVDRVYMSKVFSFTPDYDLPIRKCHRTVSDQTSGTRTEMQDH